MNSIGGYFELELPTKDKDFIHSDCVLVNSGRHALEYILKALAPKIVKLWIPYYTCNVILEPINRLGIRYDFYHINSNLEISEELNLIDGEYVIVNNYFGIKDLYIKHLSRIYKNHLIVDNSQAWYAPELLGINSFYSPRKFFGLPDGGVAWATRKLNADLKQDTSYNRCSHLLKRIDLGPQEGFNDFHTNSADIGKQPLMRMSSLTKRLLSSIDFDWIKITRRSNYEILAETLNSYNLLKLPSLNSFECPMVYPFMTDDDSLRQHLIDNKIFVATYWPNILEWCNKNSIEYNLAKSLLPLPIDQRYGESDMKKIIDVVKNH